MIPYTRLATFTAFIATLGCALYAAFLGSHPFMGTDVMLLAALAALLVYLTSLFRNFITDLISITLTAFLTQRIVVIYCWPQEMEYQRSWYLRLSFDNEVMFHTVLFYFFCTLAIALAGAVALSRKRTRKPAPFLVNADGEQVLPPVTFFGRQMSFERFSEMCSWIIIIGFLLNSYVLFVQGLGFTGQSVTRDTSVIRRLSTMGDSLGIFNILATVVFWKHIRHHKSIIYALVLSQFGGIILAASKGGQIGLFLNLITALYIARGSVPPKLVKYSFLMILFTAFVYYNVAMQLRNFILAYQLGGEVTSYYSAPVSDVLFAFSQRLGGFDWLASTMKVGREMYYPSTNLVLDLKESVNALIPGDIFAAPSDYVPISKLIPHLTRGIPVDTALGGHNEILGGLGTAYVYFGDWGGPLAMFIWTWWLVAFDRKRAHPVVRMFVLCFVLGWLQSGMISSTFFHLINILYLSLIVYMAGGVGVILRKPVISEVQLKAG